MEDIYVKERERARIPDQYKWDLNDICSSDDAWAEAKRKLTDDLSGISAFAGKLADSPEQLVRCLDLMDSLRKECTRLASYASMKSDLDTRDAKYLAMDQEMGQLGSDLSSLSSFIEPEILRISPDTIARFMKQEQALATYRHIFDDILRKKEHTGTEGEERIIAEANLMADSPVSINNVFTNADFPFPEVKLEEGTNVRLDPAAFSLHRRSSSREDRKKVFASYLGKMNEFRRTYGAQLAAEEHLFCQSAMLSFLSGTRP